MTNKEREYINRTFKDKRNEILKCLEHYKKENETKEVQYFQAQLELINELENEYFKGLLKTNKKGI